MHYYYADSSGRTAGPVELEALQAALHDGTLAPETLAVEEGGSEWKPLSTLLSHHDTPGGKAPGLPRPVELSDEDDPDPTFISAGDTEWRRPAPVRRLSAALPVRGQALAAGSVSRRPPRYVMPGTARAAGILWIVFGVLKLADCIFMMDTLAKVPNGLRDTALTIWLCFVLATVIILRAGIQTCRGTATDTRSNGAASIGLGVVAFLFVWQQSKVKDSSYSSPLLYATAAILITAGVLAFIAARPYREWKAGKPARVRR